jgi:hypothetical protein
MTAKGKPFTSDDPRINRKGRPPGKPNRTTDEIRGLFQSFLEANIERLQADFERLPPRERLQFIIAVTKFVLPAPLHELDQMNESQFNTYLKEIRENRTLILPQ